MTKIDTKRLAKVAKKPVKAPKAVSPARSKTSLYLNTNVWEDFKELTAYPRGRTSEIIESFMADYVKLNKN